MDTVRIGFFTRSVVLDLARTLGRLAEADLDVIEVPVASSPDQFGMLRDSKVDVVFTSPDNVLAYRFLPSNPLNELLDVEIIAGLDRGLGLCVGLRPGMAEAQQLRGTRFGVDVPNSGFAFVGYALLEGRGVIPGEYDVIPLGSTPKRAAALLATGCDGTVLNAGNELAARAAGCALFGSVTELGPYLGTVVARLQTSPQRAAVDRLVAVMLEISRGIADRSLEARAQASAVSVLGLDDQRAIEHVVVLRDPSQGVVANGLVDVASLTTLVGLRQRFLPDTALDSVPGAFDRMVRPDVLVA